MSGNILSSLHGYETVFREKGRAEDLPIGGITPFTALDYPGHPACVLYTQGCPWRCRYCYNWHFRPFIKVLRLISWENVRKFLWERKGSLEAVVFSGGEPTAHPSLLAAVKEVKGMGFLVGLETAGIFPYSLREVISSCNFVAMDVKAPFKDYEKITQMEGSGFESKESISVVLNSGVDYEFRTTFHPDLLTEEEVLVIAETLVQMGAKRYVLQAFQAEGCPDEKLKQAISPGVVSESLRRTLSGLFEHFEVREQQIEQLI